MMRRGMGRRGRPGLVGVAARTAVVAGTASAVSGKVAQRQQGKADEAAQAAAAQAPPPAPAPAPAAPAAGGDVAELERLGSLHQQGLLTDAEFTAAKAKVLGL